MEATAAEASGQRGGAVRPRLRRHGEAQQQLVKLCAQMPRTIQDLSREIDCGRSEIYRHVAKAIDFGLIERHDEVRGLPALLIATRAGQNASRVGLAPQRISPGGFFHMVVCSAVAGDLHARYPKVELLSDAELRRRELQEGRAIASAEDGVLPSGMGRLHRPDLVLMPEGQKPTAIEVELTPKAPDRLRRILRSWERARCIKRVVYFCSDEAFQPVKRAARKSWVAEGKVVILKLELADGADSATDRD